MNMLALVRHGMIAEVSRLRVADGVDVSRGQLVVARTHRGIQLGTVLEVKDGDQEDGESSVLRRATADDEQAQLALMQATHQEFLAWQERIANWKLDLQLVDLEWTLDRSKLILYVLNERGPECTRLALNAAASGLGVVEVQPVNSEGPLAVEGGGGCGSCGCH
jgi:cell fate regulator YaaT (PSP1 superfamily)